jgi:hypothetical protein
VSPAKRSAVVIVCVALSVLCSYAIRQGARGVTLMCDFGEIYFGAHAALQRQDPYNPHSVLREFADEGGRLPAEPAQANLGRSILSLEIYLPSTLLVFAPLALIPWAIAQNLWMILLAGSLAFCAFLAWDLGAKAAPDVWLLFAGFLLANCEALLLDGNAAGIVVSLCIVAAWCFLKNRYAWIGALLLAIALVVKPHDAVWVWLYFFLAGWPLRKRALQSLAMAAVLMMSASIWIAPFAPHWPQELRHNLFVLSAQGATDPGLFGTTSNGAGGIIDLQSLLSIFWPNPLIYNLISYLLIGTLTIVWAVAVFTRRFSMEGALFALAAIAALSQLPVYHRTNDAKLLLLALPACATLWAGKGRKRWVALALTAAAIFFTADLPLAILSQLARPLIISRSAPTSNIVAALVLRPAPLILLATGCFYLWVYLKSTSPASTPAPSDTSPNTLTAAS